MGAATAATVAWGFSGVLIVLTKEPGLVVALERLLVGVPFVGALLAFTQRRLDWSTIWRAHLVLNWAHRFVGVTVSSVIVSANPVVAAGAAAVVLHQSLGPLQIFGGLTAILAVAIVARRAARVEAFEPVAA